MIWLLQWSTIANPSRVDLKEYLYRLFEKGSGGLTIILRLTTWQAPNSRNDILRRGGDTDFPGSEGLFLLSLCCNCLRNKQSYRWTVNVQGGLAQHSSVPDRVPRKTTRFKKGRILIWDRSPSTENHFKRSDNNRCFGQHRCGTTEWANLVW